jgi:hypothetical protein
VHRDPGTRCAQNPCRGAARWPIIVAHTTEEATMPDKGPGSKGGGKKPKGGAKPGDKKKK